MKLKLLPVMLLFMGQSVMAQVVGGTYEKLAKLYNAGKYETCLFRADGYTYKESTKRDPEPYLYVSMSFYGLAMSDDEEIQADYKDAMRQAIKTGAKFVRKDKEGQLYEDNIDYINTLKDEQFRVIKKAIEVKKYSRVATNTKTYNRLNRQPDHTLNYYVGINQLLANNSTGSRTIDTATEKLEAQFKTGSVSVDPRFKSLLSKGFSDYTEYLIKSENLVKAKEVSSMGLKIFPEDGYLKVTHNMIVKSIEKQEKEKAAAVQKAREELE